MIKRLIRYFVICEKNTAMKYLFLILSFVSISMNAQDLPFPESYQLNSRSDYDELENSFINSVEWLISNGLDEKDRDLVNAFVIGWVSGSPKVSIELYSYVIDLTDKNPDLLALFLGGWAKYSIENNYTDDQNLANIEAVRVILKYYQEDQGGSIVKDKDLEKLMKLDKKGKLEKWILKQL